MGGWDVVWLLIAAGALWRAKGASPPVNYQFLGLAGLAVFVVVWNNL